MDVSLLVTGLAPLRSILRLLCFGVGRCLMARLSDSTFAGGAPKKRPGRHVKSPNKRKPGKKAYRGQGRV